MALRFCDSFDHYATANINAKYTSSSGAVIVASPPAGRTSQALGLHNNSANNVSLTLDNQSVWVVGLAFRTASIFFLTDLPLISFLDGASNQLDLRFVASAGNYKVTRNGTTLGASSTTLATNTWTYIEFKVTFHGSTGNYEVRANGSNVLSGEGVNTSATGNAYASVIKLSCITDNVTYIDDFYICDGTGFDNNDFLGNISVGKILPDGAGNYTQFTASEGSNYQCVDDASLNVLDFVSEDTAGHKDSYTFGAIGVTGSIKGIQVLAAAWKGDASSRTMRRLIRISGADYTGSSVSLGTSSSIYVRECLDNSPASSSGWSISEIDGAEFGYEFVS